LKSETDDIKWYKSLTVRVWLRRRSDHNTCTSTRSLGAAGTNVGKNTLQSNSVLRWEPGGEGTSSTLLDVLRRGKSKGSSEEDGESREETHDEDDSAVDDMFVQAEGWLIYVHPILSAGSALDDLDVCMNNIFGPSLQTEPRVRQGDNRLELCWSFLEHVRFSWSYPSVHIHSGTTR
jgi:hypothetical protein